MNTRQNVATKLGAARTRLILEHPFIGALVMHLPLTAAERTWCPTTATDARAFYYNPEFIAGLTLAQTQFMLAHEALHCALGHFARRNYRQQLRWDVACDHAVNLMLADEGLKPPPHALLNPAYRGLSAEEIYPLIPADTRERSIDRHVFDAAAGSAAQSAGGTPGTQHARRRGQSAAGYDNAAAADSWDDAGDEGRTRSELQSAPPQHITNEREQLLQQWQSRLAAAAQQARHAGRLGDSWWRTIDQLLQPQLPWRMLLARYLMSVAREDYSFQRLSRRDGNALLPRLHSDEVDLFIALDTSGSISDDELREFAAEIDALKSQLRARVTLHACDEQLDARGPWCFQSWEPLALPPRIGGGGGTSFKPVFEWMADRRLRPDLLLYFTDGEGTFPEPMPDYPVVWLIKGKAKVPWGERIQLN